MSRTPVVIGESSQLGQSLKRIHPNWRYINRHHLDLLKTEDIRRYFQKEEEIILNFASFNAVDDAESRRRDEANKINATAVGELARCAKHFIHISSDYVFSGEKRSPYIESDAVGPVNFYGETKLQGEVLALRNNPKSVILRTSWLYSEFSKNFVKRMHELAMTRNELKVVNDQIGTPTYAGDLAAVISMISANVTAHEGQIYHFSNEGECSWYDFAKEIFKYKNKDVKVSPISARDYPVPTRRPTYTVLDKSKIKKALSIDVPNWAHSLSEFLTHPAFVPKLK